MFVKAFPNSHGCWVTGRALGRISTDQFDWVIATMTDAVFPITIHPDSAGKPHVLMTLERLVDHMLAHPGVRMVTFARWQSFASACRSEAGTSWRHSGLSGRFANGRSGGGHVQRMRIPERFDSIEGVAGEGVPQHVGSRSGVSRMALVDCCSMPGSGWASTDGGLSSAAPPALQGS